MVTKQLYFAEVAPRDQVGKFLKKPGAIPASAEVATVWKGEFLGDFSLLEYPTLSVIRRYRANGQGLRFYDNMLLADADLQGLLSLIYDKVLHYPWVIRAASNDPQHQAHAEFLRFAVKYIPHLQNALRHFLDSYTRGFSVIEKMYEVVPRGEFAGAVVWSDLLDKPTRWWTFDPGRNLRMRTVKSYSPGEPVDQRKFIVTTYGTNSDPFGEPILDSCYWLWRLRHHAMKSHAIYMDKWASPTGRAKYQSSTNEGTNEANRQKAMKVLQAIQADQSIAYPDGMELSLLESMRNGSVSFESYEDQLWGALSRLITGQTLAGSGQKGGSYALGRVHAEAIANKAEMLALFVSSYFSRELRELVDRNFGEQDAYPRFEILARDLADKQAFLEVELAEISNGHRSSRQYADEYLQIVLPTDASDDLQPPTGEQLPQQIAVPPSLAAPNPKTSLVLLAAPKHHELHKQAKAMAQTVRAHMDKVGSTATSKAKPAIRRVVSSIASGIRKKKSVKSVTKRSLLKDVKGYTPGLAPIFNGMISGSTDAPASLAAGDSSDAAKIAEALTMYSIVESIAERAAEAPDGMTASDFADSLLDENATSDSVVNAQSAIFDNIHSTNIASMATGALRDKLADPAYRNANPYVMIVTQPDARLGHHLMDGYVMSAEDAQTSSLLPPYDFGCRCVPIPISQGTAQEMGLTGAQPTGPIPKGNITARGFAPAFTETDTQSQLAALREKANELHAEDVEAYAQMKLWLVALFGFDPLISDPPGDRNAS